MTRMMVDGAHYEVRSGGHGPAVLLIHGFTGRGADWGPFLPALRAAHTTIVVDLLGHGRSDAPTDPARHAVKRQASDLATILRRLDAAPAAVVGYSFGARIALRIAIDHPDVVRSLILESPSAGFGHPAERKARRAAEEELVRHIQEDGLAAFIETWESAPLFAAERRLPPKVRERIHAGRLRNRPEGLIASLLGAGQGVMTPMHDRLGAVTAPTLVVAGSLDPVGLERSRVVADGIPGARLVVLHDHGHAAHREAPALFRHFLIDHLDTRSDA